MKTKILKLLQLKQLYGAYLSGERYSSALYLPKSDDIIGNNLGGNASKITPPNSLEMLISNCSLCNRVKQCKQPSFGLLHPHSDICFISEIPLLDERGEFVHNKSALMLQKIIHAVFALPLSRVSILSLVKCDAYNPHCERSEILSCMSFTLSQLQICSPKVCILFGDRVGEYILGQHLEHSRILWHNNMKFLITYALSEVVRNPSLKPRVRDDFLVAKGQL